MHEQWIFTIHLRRLFTFLINASNSVKGNNERNSRRNEIAFRWGVWHFLSFFKDLLERIIIERAAKLYLSSTISWSFWLVTIPFDLISQIDLVSNWKHHEISSKVLQVKSCKTFIPLKLSRQSTLWSQVDYCFLSDFSHYVKRGTSRCSKSLGSRSFFNSSVNYWPKHKPCLNPRTNLFRRIIDLKSLCPPIEENWKPRNVHHWFHQLRCFPSEQKGNFNVEKRPLGRLALLAGRTVMKVKRCNYWAVHVGFSIFPLLFFQFCRFSLNYSSTTPFV